MGEQLLLVITDDGHVLQLGAVLAAEVKLGFRKIRFPGDISLRKLETVHSLHEAKHTELLGSLLQVDQRIVSLVFAQSFPFSLAFAGLLLPGGLGGFSWRLRESRRRFDFIIKT